MNLPIRVINKSTASPSERSRAAYIGRGTPLGNPFKVKPWGPHERGTTLPLYEEHLRRAIGERDDAVCDELNRLFALARRAAQDGTDLLLMCHCKPNPCHGDVVQAILLEKARPQAGKRELIARIQSEEGVSYRTAHDDVCGHDEQHTADDYERHSNL